MIFFSISTETPWESLKRFGMKRWSGGKKEGGGSRKIEKAGAGPEDS